VREHVETTRASASHTRTIMCDTTEGIALEENKHFSLLTSRSLDATSSIYANTRHARVLDKADANFSMCCFP
jgi:hypothetical protein